jgi:hypothetical protein
MTTSLISFRWLISQARVAAAGARAARGEPATGRDRKVSRKERMDVLGMDLRGDEFVYRYIFSRQIWSTRQECVNEVTGQVPEEREPV